eukprot:31389-Pelagococcus_subviridis.AAC.1
MTSLPLASCGAKPRSSGDGAAAAPAAVFFSPSSPSVPFTSSSHADVRAIASSTVSGGGVSGIAPPRAAAFVGFDAVVPSSSPPPPPSSSPSPPSPPTGCTTASASAPRGMSTGGGAFTRSLSGLLGSLFALDAPGDLIGDRSAEAFPFPFPFSFSSPPAPPRGGVDGHSPLIIALMRATFEISASTRSAFNLRISSRSRRCVGVNIAHRRKSTAAAT